MNEQTRTQEEQELRRDIAETREELGETVEALVQKTDVKGQAKAKADEVRERVKKRPGPAVTIAALAAVGIAIGWMLRRR